MLAVSENHAASPPVKGLRADGQLLPYLRAALDAARKLAEAGVTPTPKNLSDVLGINNVAAGQRIRGLRRLGLWEWGHFARTRVPVWKQIPPDKPDPNTSVPLAKTTTTPLSREEAVLRYLSEYRPRKGVVMNSELRRTVRAYVREWKRGRRSTTTTGPTDAG